MKRIINKLEYDCYIKSFMCSLSRFDNYYLMPTNDAV